MLIEDGGFLFMLKKKIKNINGKNGNKEKNVLSPAEQVLASQF